MKKTFQQLEFDTNNQVSESENEQVDLKATEDWNITKEKETAVEKFQEAPKEEQKQLTPIQRFQQNIEQYEQTVLPNLLKKHNIDPAQFKQIVLSEIKKNPKLLEAFMSNPASMFASILAGAEIGLIPSDMLGEFYLIPRRIDNKAAVTPLIGYKGLVNILLRSGEITRIHTEVVYEGEHFEPIYGLEPNIIHKPNFNLPRTSDKVKFVYAVAKMKNGEYQFTVLSKLDIINIQSLSRYNNDLYFNDKKDPNKWMIRKIALVQLSKMLPKDYYSKKAVEMDGQLEGGAMLVLDEDNQVKVVDGKKISTLKQASVVNTLNSLPEIPQ
jgi:recombination protein RecT